MTEWILQLGGYVTAVAGMLAAVNQWLVKPMKKFWAAEVSEKIDRLDARVRSIEKTLTTTQNDVSDMLADQLAKAHAEAMHRGWCSDAEKRRYVDLHKRYTARGHNHLTAQYEEDLLRLPSHAPQRTPRRAAQTMAKEAGA